MVMIIIISTVIIIVILLFSLEHQPIHQRPIDALGVFSDRQTKSTPLDKYQQGCLEIKPELDRSPSHAVGSLPAAFGSKPKSFGSLSPALYL